MANPTPYYVSFSSGDLEAAVNAIRLM
ncbi:hypothetical protein ACNKHR_07175 [Shigella flexneri]